MFVAGVVLGRGRKMTRDDCTLRQPPAGFDSVLGEPHAGGALNFDECVVYVDDAAITKYLILYQP
jgi:hypothetical protein